MNLRLRKLLLGSLLAAFCGQTALVYFDDTADGHPVLGAAARQGRLLWHAHNCQVCHQIHGFGGFLGPDLTNAAPRLTRLRLDAVLTAGSRQMPAFRFAPDEIDAIGAFLRELDRTGVGVARRIVPPGPEAVFDAIAKRAAEHRPPDDAQRGAATFRRLCAGCHVPFQSTPLGLDTAPDLSGAVDRLTEAAIVDTIVKGRPPKGMPSWSHLPTTHVDDLVAFLRWLRRERNPIAATLDTATSEHGLPWWEFR